MKVTTARIAQPSSPTALLAEDDELIREIVATYLQRLGYHVLEAKNGEVAVDIIEQLEAEGLDLIVTDSLMPKLGGEAVINAAADRHTCRHFLVISGFAPEMAHRAKNPDPHSGFLAKPFTFDAFKTKIGELTCDAS